MSGVVMMVEEVGRGGLASMWGARAGDGAVEVAVRGHEEM